MYKGPPRVLLTCTWPAIVFNRVGNFNTSDAKSADCGDVGIKLSENERCRGWGVMQGKLKGKKVVGYWNKHGNLGTCIKVKVREFAAISMNFIWF